MNSIHTPRLMLIPLTLEQLEAGLRSIPALSFNLGIPLVENLFSGIVERAVSMKIEKMKKVPASDHPWFTYWLIVITVDKAGAGMVGFKGKPDENGSVEIGYGIDETFQRRGYMTEAVHALADWAFTHQECSAITASVVLVNNIASQKVLIKAGFTEVSSSDEGVNYELKRVDFQHWPAIS